jgi:hypothetical protein
MSGLHLFAALFLDIGAWKGDLQKTLFGDLIRIERLTKSHGLSFIMIDMPEGGKVLDQALSSGRLWADQLPETFGKVEAPSRQFLHGLFSEIFDESGFIKHQASADAVTFLRQVLYLAKKVRKECSNAAILAEVEAYQAIDSGLRRPNLDWVGDDLFPHKGRSRVSLLDTDDTPDWCRTYDPAPHPLIRYVEATADQLISRFPEFDWREIKPKHGPGAVADGRRGIDKYSFPCWPLKLERIFPFNYFGLSREDLICSEVPHPSLAEKPARLLAVPKTLKGPRMIASEPVAHQYIQLGLMRWFRDNMPRTLRSTIDFKKQGLSQRACLEASAWGDLATVDLSAASDRLSCWVVERIFRSNPSILIALHACRTRWLVNATKVGEPYFIRLNKYAPMGNGTTFPVQSIVYAIIAIACILYEANQWPSHSAIRKAAQKVRVFGDDIILPSSAVSSLTRALAHCELVVNRMKTHTEGHFRESCGMDAFKGVDVTPLYVSDLECGNTAISIQSWVDVCKNAAQKGLHALCAEMESQINPELRELLPRSQEPLGCLTLWSYYPGTVLGGKRRYNRSLHREEVLGLQQESRDVRRKRESYANLLQYFVEDPAPDTHWESGFVVRKRSLIRKRWVPMYKTTRKGKE